MRWSDGYLTVGPVGGIPIRFHWSAPLGALIWTGGNPSLLRIIAFLAIVLLHELGHAAVVRWTRGHVTEIKLHALGGQCGWHGHATPIQRAMIAFGGVWAQGLIALSAWIVTLAAPGLLPASLVEMLLVYNLYMAAFNLVPVAPLDGSEAWKLFPLWFGVERKRAKKRRELDKVQRELKQILATAASKTKDNPVTPIKRTLH